jgi:hypothetical protein
MSAPTETHGPSQPLRRLADEIRVRLHLARMEVKDAWARLEPRIHEYERKAERATEKAKSGLAEVRRELEKELEDLLAKLKRH